MAPTQRPGRSAAWKSLPAIPTSPSRSAHVRSRWLLPFENPGPSTSMACKPWSASTWSLDSRRSWGGCAMRPRRRLPGSSESPDSLSSLGLSTQAGHPSPRYRAKTSRVLATWRVRDQVIGKVATTQVCAGEKHAERHQDRSRARAFAGDQPWPRFAGLDPCEAMPWRCKVQDRHRG